MLKLHIPEPNDSRIIVALDFPEVKQALDFAKNIDPDECCALKIGKELFVAGGPQVVEDIKALGFDIFLDLKFHDIPNTVAGAIRAAARLDVWMVNVHASGGRKMMEAAVDAVKSVSHPPLVIGVTVLTSMEATDLVEVGFNNAGNSTIDSVTRLALLVRECGLDGVVASGKEASTIRRYCGNDFLIVTPSIRLSDGDANDQARIVTPEMAIKAGADYLVVGRPITQAADPNLALTAFNSMVRLAL
jgi:orotidine-5'-phosphate decarboxylase